MRRRLQGRYNNCQARRGGYHPPVCPRNRWPRGARQGELPQRGKRRCPGVRLGAPNGAPAATQRSGRRGEKEAQRMIRSLGRRCRGDLWSPAQWRPGLPSGACAAGCTNQARTGRGCTPGSFFCSFQALPRPGRPAATQRSGRRGERRHSERLRRHIARRAGACPRRPFRIRRRAGCAGNDKGRTPAPDVRPSSKERGYNEMKRNCLLRV